MSEDLQNVSGSRVMRTIAIGVFKKPTTETLHILSEPVIPVTLICDNIRDPGNLGSIIRNAAAAGCQNILLTK
ncbi:hypothetical protein AVEN_20666-1, partial [Araneus ventricosus]